MTVSQWEILIPLVFVALLEIAPAVLSLFLADFWVVVMLEGRDLWFDNRPE